jgi:hypothetical protein
MHRLMVAAQRSLAKHRQTAGELDPRGGEPPAPGDLFVAAATREFPVEWLVVELAPRPPARWLVLPADTNPLLGSADLALPTGAAAGPLSLRCRYGVWLACGALDPALRTGRVAPEVVAGALRRHGLTGTPPDLPADGDPEYEDWVDEVLDPAHAALAAAAGEPAAAAGETESAAAGTRLPPRASF